ncbi:MAG: fumarylacetoacetate hydrolase family protein [Proteobacteria bacterium]|nr:fumarylacetoacetate hydrolase family protein [Pseudomonadota bacterium]
MNDDDIRQRAAELMAAHAARQPFTPFTADAALPSLADAYAVQRTYVASLAAQLDTHIAGYKIGLTSPRMQAMCGIDSPIAGRVLASRLLGDGACLRRADYGRLGIEFEIGVRMGADLPAAAAPHDQERVAAAVAAVCVAVEVVDDRAAQYQGLDMASLVADNSWNAGVILGEWQSRWPNLPDLLGVVSRNGVTVDQGHGRDVLGHPFHALTWLANHLADSGEGLRAGDVVATGSIVPTRFPLEAEQYRYSIAGLGALSFSIVD